MRSSNWSHFTNEEIKAHGVKIFCQDHSQQAVEQDLKPSSLTLKSVLLNCWEEGPSYILIVANRAGPPWQGCRGITLHWGKPGPRAGWLALLGLDASSPSPLPTERQGKLPPAHPAEVPSRKKAKEKKGIASSPPDRDSAPTLCLNCSPGPVCGRQRDHLRGGVRQAGKGVWVITHLCLFLPGQLGAESEKPGVVSAVTQPGEGVEPEKELGDQRPFTPSH